MRIFDIKRGSEKGAMNKVAEYVAPLMCKARSYLPTSSKVNADDLAGHLRSQNLAYEAAVEIAKELHPGVTELRISELMDTYLRDCGVKSFFHSSFAWFGERTGFYDFKNYLDFLPLHRELQEGEVVILDVAPIVDGYTADIGFTTSMGPHPELKKMQQFLLELRGLIPSLFNQGLSGKEIYQTLDKKISEHNYTNRHSMYPGEVIGHRVHKNYFHQLGGLVRPFSVQAYFDLFSRGLYPELLGPEHSGSLDGLWAIEPHLGSRDKSFGAKFEEILVVEQGQARWLSDEVPHLQVSL